MKKEALIIVILSCLATFGLTKTSFCFSPTAEFLCEMGEVYYDAGDYDGALREFNNALMVEPENQSAKKYIKKIFEREIARAREYKREYTLKPQEAIKDEPAQLASNRDYIRQPESEKSEYEYAEYMHGARAEQEDSRAWKLGVNFQASSFTGDYGDPDGKSTTITYFSETVKYIGSDGEIALTFPYLIRNGGGVTVGETSAAGAQSIPKRADGVGDLTLKGEYYWIEETDEFPSVDLTAKVKFPLANHDRGLGTGRFDFGTGTSLMKRFGSFITLLDLGLLVRQRPNASTIKPVRFDYSLGSGYMFTNKFSSYLFLDSSTKSSKNDKKPLELVLASTYKLKKELTVNGYLLFGLSKSSPKIGASTGITRYF